MRKFAKDWPVAALRPTGVYGIVEPLERSKWFSLVKDALDGVAVPERVATEVHGDDVASATWALLQAPPEALGGRAFNCSDLVVSQRAIVLMVHAIAGISSPLPEEGAPPRGIMRTDALEALSVTFGGKALFEKTVAALVAAAMQAR